jgi:hypothetical protein
MFHLRAILPFAGAAGNIGRSHFARLSLFPIQDGHFDERVACERGLEFLYSFE